MKIVKISCLILMYMYLGEATAGEKLTIENWKINPDIVQVRKIYSVIKKSESQFQKHYISYDIKSSSCATYPIQEKSIFVDKQDKVRKLAVTQIISHRVPQLIERYYDENGKLRFVFTSHIGSEIRIYLDSMGVVFWAVEKGSSGFSRADYENGDWETIPENSEKAFELFKKAEKCPITGKG